MATGKFPFARLLKINAVSSIIAVMEYKVVETSTVTDEEIERILNAWTGKGYVFESIQFVRSDSSRRPVMAFLFFAKDSNA